MSDLSTLLDRVEKHELRKDEDGNLIPEIARKLVPLYQALMMEVYYRFIVIRGGRGGSKSYSILLLLMILAMREPVSILCCREIMRNLKQSSFPLMQQIARKYGIDKYFNFIRSDSRVVCTITGATFMFMGLRTADSESIKSLPEVDYAFCEEASSISATSLKRFEHSVRGGTYNEEGTIIFAYNPLSPDSYIHKNYGDANDPPEDTKIIDICIWSNPFYNKGNLKAAIRDKRRDPLEFNHTWGGHVWNKSTDLVFQNWSELDLDGVVELLKLEPMFGMDFGNVHPNVITSTYYIPRELHGKYEEFQSVEEDVIYVSHAHYAVKLKPDLLPALIAGDDDRKHVPAKFRRWENPYNEPGVPGVKRKNSVIVCDNENAQMITHLRTFGLNAIPAIKGPGSVEDGISFCHNAWIFIHPRNSRFMVDMINYKYEYCEETARVTNKLIKEYDDGPDSMRYSLEARRRVTQGKVTSVRQSGIYGNSESVYKTPVVKEMTKRKPSLTLNPRINKSNQGTTNDRLKSALRLRQ